MNWLVIAVVGAAAAWFEYNYQRSRHSKKKAADANPSADTAPAQPAQAAPETAHVTEAGHAPSVSPGDENDTRRNAPDSSAGVQAHSTFAQP